MSRACSACHCWLAQHVADMAGLYQTHTDTPNMTSLFGFCWHFDVVYNSFSWVVVDELSRNSYSLARSPLLGRGRRIYRERESSCRNATHHQFAQRRREFLQKRSTHQHTMFFCLLVCLLVWLVGWLLLFVVVVANAVAVAVVVVVAAVVVAVAQQKPVILDALPLASAGVGG